MQVSSDGELLVKTAAWANNNIVSSHPKANKPNSLWILNLRPKLQLFARELIQEILPKRSRIRSLGISIDGNCRFVIRRIKL